jgi:transposase
MKKTPTALGQDTTKRGTLYMGIDLSASAWEIAFTDGARERRRKVEAWDLDGLSGEAARAREKFGLAGDGRGLCVQEAGRDGFSAHRALAARGWESVVVDSSSIEVSRRARRAKTDRLDAASLARMLLRWDGGERKVWSVARVPGEGTEMARRAGRERERLTKEKTAHGNRVRSLLATQGIRVGAIPADLGAYLERVRRWDGTPVPGPLREELLRQEARRRLAEEQIAGLVAARTTALRTRATGEARRAALLATLRGIGPVGAWTLAHEFLWRDFRNGKEVGAAAGLVGTPYASGTTARDQGISKAGSRRVRALMVELSWGWLRYQPRSALARWFLERFGGGNGRTRRIGIVALARKLLIALWRYGDQGLVPEGALLKA